MQSGRGQSHAVKHSDDRQLVCHRTTATSRVTKAHHASHPAHLQRNEWTFANAPRTRAACCIAIALERSRRGSDSADVPADAGICRRLPLIIGIVIHLSSQTTSARLDIAAPFVLLMFACDVCLPNVARPMQRRTVRSLDGGCSIRLLQDEQDKSVPRACPCANASAGNIFTEA